MSRRLNSGSVFCVTVAALVLTVELGHAQTEAPAADATATSRYVIGSSVQSDRHLNVRNAPAGSKVGVQVDGRFGIVLEGPKVAAYGGTPYQWWKVDWEIGVDGWCATVGIQPVEIDLEHGNKQVAAMLKDRPQMATFTDVLGIKHTITEKDPIWQWVAKRYGTLVNDHKIFWDSSDVKKPDHYEADHTIPWKNQPAQIRLRSKIRTTPKGRWQKQPLGKMWSSVVFELMNVTNAGGFLRLWEEAKAGKLSREEYAVGNQQLEYYACVALKNFYYSHFEPWAKTHGYGPTDDARGEGFYLWLPDSYDAWIASYSDGSYDYFYSYFDETIVPYLKQKGRFDARRHSPAKPR